MAIRRILIANRGEIAARIIRTCRVLGIETVLAVSTADRDSEPARQADRVVCIGPAKSADSYLNAAAIVHAAVATRADAIHPGYGFLSERAALPQLCATAGIVFIGPTAEQMAAVGDKLRARAEAEAAHVPVVPGGAAESSAEAQSLARRIAVPLLVKAVGGGGGRGLKRVDRIEDLPGLLDLAAAEAGAAFGDARIYLEHFVDRGRHVEVQVLGDGDGRVIQLGERDCSVQRRYQKLIEETPAPGLSAALRHSLQQAAVRFAERLAYRGAGTVEFIVDVERDAFYFLEMNARIQVEHPVTEAVTGIDLIAEQIAIADGKGLRLRQSEVRTEGCAIECRINAEDSRNEFKPSPGRVREVSWPSGPGIRVDTHIVPGSSIPPFYDSLDGQDHRLGQGSRRRTGAAARRHLGHTHQRGAEQSRLSCRRVGRCGISNRRRRYGLCRAALCPTAGSDRSHRGGCPWLTFNWSRPRCATATSACGLLWVSIRREPSRIAPVMDRVGFRAIDFTTSTHMGVAVRYKKEDPWERIRLMAAATPNTPLQFMSTGFRFISWETASPDFMALAFRTLARNGIRRFCLADPMNDAESNMACARMVKEGGGEYVIVALVFTLSPIHDDAHYVERARMLAACPFVDALYIKDPGGLLEPGARADPHSGHQGGDRRQAAGIAFSLHHRARRTHLYGRAQPRRVGAAVCFRCGRRRHLEPAFRARGRESAGAGTSRGRR